ncbi:hypothetical protein VB620_05510 [Nodularia harveyana UHCC-0300]|uniref:Uncharacterized protein n=1 Tax=Nodularia harveyana UHCC-0300 TaxID=2974287 RepID=A0ABU5UB93_9CYAN|nr:hypothetical protein [Nodularia harveyana]MEA5580796.1 hypothetical protein [Nodularia harveyana UHCC-0300]
MNNTQPEATNPQQLNNNKMSLFKPVNLEQQESVTGGLLSSSIFDFLPSGLVIPGVEEAEAAVNAVEDVLQEAETLGFVIEFPFDLFFD